MVLALGLQSLLIVDSFPITLFAEPIQPIKSLVTHIFVDDDAIIATKEYLGFQRKMLQPRHFFDISTYLTRAIILQVWNLPTTSYFTYYSLFFILFLYTHVDDFVFLGLSLVASKKQGKFVFDWYISIRKRLEVDGYSQFISSYITIFYKIIHGYSLPIFIPQKK